jgi:hypothetical protein
VVIQSTAKLQLVGRIRCGRWSSRRVIVIRVEGAASLRLPRLSLIAVTTMTCSY